MTKITTPAQLVENFLPEYEKRHREEYINNAREELPREEVERKFVDHFFAEALSEALKAQRLACAHTLDYLTEGRTSVWFDAILNTPIPEPKNK